MRILLVTPILDPYFLWAGSHRVVYDIAKSLTERGHNVVVLTSDMLNIRTKIKQPIDQTDLHSHVKIIRARTLSRKLTEMTSMTFSIDMANFLRKQLQSSDVVHAHEYETFENIILHYYARRYSVPYVLQAHGSLPRTGESGVKRVFDQVFGPRILRDASRVIALSEVEAIQYEKAGVDKRKIAIVPNGIAFEDYRDLPPKGSFKSKFKIDDDKKVILYLGRIHKTKGIELLVKAYAFMVNDMKLNGALLTVAGPDDGYLSEVKLLANDLGVSDSVMFTGFISEKEKLEALVDADVFVTPSFYGFPMTFLEACAAGTPIITTTLGDTLEWMDGNVGCVTSPVDRDLAKAIYDVISNDGLRRKLSGKCLQIVRTEFSLEKAVDSLEKVYREVAC